MTPTSLDQHEKAARTVLTSLGLELVEEGQVPRSGHGSSLPLVGRNGGGKTYLLKYYLPPAGGAVLPAQVRHEDYARRETGFYRLLDSTDPERRDFPAPKTVAVGPGEPAPWLLGSEDDLRGGGALLGSLGGSLGGRGSKNA